MIRVAPFLLASALLAQTPRPLTLAEAEAIAVRAHPRLLSARLSAQAEAEKSVQVKAGLMPMVAANVTGSVAENGTRVGAGNLNASSMFSRSATGLNITQTVFDFGRTKALTGAAESRASSLNENVRAIRAEVVLRVREAYFRTLMAQAQLRVMRQAVETRRTELKQIDALTRNQLRSTLDLSFAELLVSQAELDLNQAENAAASAMILLTAAMGTTAEESYTLADIEDPAALGENSAGLVAEALRSRPDIAALRLQAVAARQFAESEKRLAWPTLSAVGVAGVYGPKDDNLRPRYAGVGMNLTIPLFNGGQFASRKREADLRVEAAAQDVRDLEVRIARDVRAAWVEASNAHRRLAVAANVVAQSARTVRLARARFNLGLSTIVELNTAVLAETSSEVAAAAARYDYLLKRSILDYHANLLP